MHFTTLEVKVFPSAKLGGSTQFLSFLCSSTSLQFFWLSWPLKPFFPLIIICIYTALLISNSFIPIISFDSYHHSVKQVGRIGNIILIWLVKKMTYWEVVTCLMLITESKLEKPGTLVITPGFFLLGNISCLSCFIHFISSEKHKNHLKDSHGTPQELNIKKTGSSEQNQWEVGCR